MPTNPADCPPSLTHLLLIAREQLELINMDIDELFENLETSRLNLLEILEQLPDEAMIQDGVMGDWSAADILAHIVAWESELVTCLMKLDQGKKPSRMLEAIADVDGYNERVYQENKGRDLDLIYDDLKNVRIQLEEWLPEFSHRDLNDGKRYGWNNDIPLWQIIEANSFGHEADHMAELEDFALRWNAEQGLDEGVIE